MVRTQIYLTKRERDGLRRIAMRNGAVLDDIGPGAGVPFSTFLIGDRLTDSYRGPRYF